MPIGFAVDSSSLIAYFAGESGTDVAQVREAIDRDILFLPPATLTEIMSARRPDNTVLTKVRTLALVPLYMGFWERAGLLRGNLLQRGYKARLGDSLIAQSCIDHDVPLITRDKDFHHFAEVGGLRLA